MSNMRKLEKWGIIISIIIGIIIGIIFLIFTPIISIIIGLFYVVPYVIGLIFILVHIIVAKVCKYKIKVHVLVMGILILGVIAVLILLSMLTKQIVVSNYKQVMLFINLRYVTVFTYLSLSIIGMLAVILVPLIRNNKIFVVIEAVVKVSVCVISSIMVFLFIYWTAVIVYPFPTYKTSTGKVEYILINMSEVSQKSYENYPAYEVYFFNDNNELLNVDSYQTYSIDMYLDVCDTVLENSNNVFSKEEFLAGNIEHISEIQDEEKCNKRIEFKNNEIINIKEFK